MTSFRANKAGFDSMANGPEAYRVVRAKAEEAKAIAEGLAQDFRITGDYAESFEVIEGPTTVSGEARASAVLKNHSDHAAAVEFGNEHAHRAHRVLGKALDAVRSD
jgi:hypothetical protein